VVFFAHHSHADTSHKVKKVQKKILHHAASSILLKKEKRKKRKREKEEGSTADQQRCRANPWPAIDAQPSYATHPCRPDPRSSSPVDPGPL
jgi:hypothetical protein